MSFSTIHRDLFGVWGVVVSLLCLFTYNLNTTKMSQKQGLWSIDLALGKAEERDNCMDLKLSAWHLTNQSAFAGISPVTASFLEGVCTTDIQTADWSWE